MDNLRNNINSPDELISDLSYLGRNGHSIDEISFILSTTCCLVKGLYSDHLSELNKAILDDLIYFHRAVDHEEYCKILKAVIRGLPAEKGVQHDWVLQALDHVLEDDNVDLVRQLLEYIPRQDILNLELVHRAAAHCAIGTTVYLLQLGCRIDEFDDRKRTPLMSFCYQACQDQCYDEHHQKYLRLLLDHGAYVRYQDDYGYNAINYLGEVEDDNPLLNMLEESIKKI